MSHDLEMEVASVYAIASATLGRIAEDLFLWTTSEFDFIELPDRYCTGSSIMPQKKNPDVAELVRGKSARVHGNLTALLTLMKGQPLAYNRDNQEDKEPLFDTIDTVRNSLHAFADMVPNMQVHASAMFDAARKGFATATDLADYLVRKNVPFRDAHEIVGKAVRHGVEQKKDLSDMSLEELRQFSGVIDEDVFTVLTLEGSVSARNHLGGTAPAQVRAQVAAARERLAAQTTD
jgi:argininosuccinate lyase